MSLETNEVLARVLGRWASLLDQTIMSVGPRTDKEKVVHSLVVLRATSLKGLERATGLSKDVILPIIAGLDSKFDVTGDATTGFKTSSDPEKTLALSMYIEELSNERSVVRRPTP